MLRVTVLELPATWGSPRAALDAVDAELGRGVPTDLVLLPEASLTGYVSAEGDFDLSRFAEPIDGATASALAGLARHHGIHLVAPLVLDEDCHCFNAMVAFDPRGEPLFTYRKRHPWIPETWASPGPLAPPSVVVRGVTLSIAVCYDIHFLEEESSDVLGAADLLLFPTAWVEEGDSRPSMLAGIARRHRVAIANANWAPGVVRVPGQGSSAIYDARGHVVARVATSRVITRADWALELASGA